MAFDGILITEIFHSLQGETSLSGLRFAFIRLTGCNLRCTYCDSTYAFKGGKRMSIDEILTTIQPFQVKHVLLTGGEPLLQRNTSKLVDSLNSKGYTVSIETHGEVSIEQVAKKARIVMDIKTPSSGMSRGNWRNNLPFLKTTDEIKFVITSQEDYFWARNILKTHSLNVQDILFSPVMATKNSPGHFQGVDVQWLAEKIIEDRLPVRLQLQIHKAIWGLDRIGV